MLDLGINGYTRQEVIDQLHGRNGSRGLVKFRYDLLNKDDVKIGELQAQPGRVAMNSLAEIKRTATFQVTEQEAQDVDWLNDRIRPVFCLQMPEISRTYRVWHTVSPTFTRSSVAYLSDGTQVAANAPRLEPSQMTYGKAILIEEGTTNLLTANQSSVETSLPAGYVVDGVSVTISRVTTQARYGIASIQVSCASGGGAYDGADLWNGAIGTGWPVTEGKTYTISLYAKGANGGEPFWFAVYSSDWTFLNEIKTLLTTTWQRFAITITIPAGKSGIFILARRDYTTNAVTFYVDGLQLEQKTYATSFINGTRAAETLAIPTEGVLNPQEGTVEFWINLKAWASGVSDYCLWSTKNTKRLDMWFSKNYGDGQLVVWDDVSGLNSGFSGSSALNSWHYITYTWGAFGQKIYVDGVFKASTTRLITSNNIGDLLRIGNYYNGSQPNGLIDDLRISNRARTDAEILAAYASGRALEVDEATTAKFNFDDKLAGEYFTITSEYKPSQQIEWPLGVFLLSSPTRKNENRKIKRDIEAYDASLILKEDKFTDRYRIAAGTKYTTAINDILNSAGIWKIRIIDHPGTLGADKEFEIGATKLQAVNQLLAEINYTSLWVDENGFFTAQAYVLPSSREVEYEYRNNEISIIHPGASEELDLFAVPNKWVRYVSNPDKTIALRSVYTNDLSTSPTSTVNRGRTIVDIGSVDDIYDQATLDAYTKRQAYEASQIYAKFEFSTALMPHHSFLDCLFVEHTDFGISSKYIESSWAMDLQAGGRMAHSCRRVIQI